MPDQNTSTTGALRVALTQEHWDQIADVLNRYSPGTEMDLDLAAREKQLSAINALRAELRTPAQQDQPALSLDADSDLLMIAREALESEKTVAALTWKYHGQMPIDEEFKGDEEQEDSAARRKARDRARTDLRELAKNLGDGGAGEADQLREALKEISWIGRGETQSKTEGDMKNVARAALKAATPGPSNPHREALEQIATGQISGGGSDVEHLAICRDIASRALGAPATQPDPSYLSEEAVRQLLDDDGPVLLEVREAICDGFAEGWHYQDGSEAHPNDASVDALGDEVSDRVKAKLAASLSASSETGGAGETNPDGWTAPVAAIDAAWRAFEDLDGSPTPHRNAVALAVSAAFLAAAPTQQSALKDIKVLTAAWGDGLRALTVKTPEGILRLVPEPASPQQSVPDSGEATGDGEEQ